jgi:hypothetical protein
MSGPQVEAMDRCLAREPELLEWWPRYVKGWCKAAGDACEPGLEAGATAR